LSRTGHDIAAGAEPLQAGRMSCDGRPLTRAWALD